MNLTGGSEFVVEKIQPLQGRTEGKQTQGSPAGQPWAIILLRLWGSSEPTQLSTAISPHWGLRG